MIYHSGDKSIRKNEHESLGQKKSNLKKCRKKLFVKLLLKAIYVHY